MARVYLLSTTSNIFSVKTNNLSKAHVTRDSSDPATRQSV